MFMDRFGHLSGNGNDFSFPLWAETPEVIFNLIAGYEKNPHLENTEHNNSIKTQFRMDIFFEKRLVTAGIESR